MLLPDRKLTPTSDLQNHTKGLTGAAMGTQSTLITFPIKNFTINSADMNSITKIDQLNWSIKLPWFPLQIWCLGKGMAHRMYLSSGEVRNKTCVVIEKVQHAVSKSGLFKHCSQALRYAWCTIVGAYG
jgi:hypothetical protein